MYNKHCLAIDYSIIGGGVIAGSSSKGTGYNYGCSVRCIV